MHAKLKKQLASSLVLAVVLFFVILLFAPPAGKTEHISVDGGSGKPSHATARRENPIGEFLDAFKTPIELYGHIEDQNGKPVSGATVKLYPLDSPDETSTDSEVVMVSDAGGDFSVIGLKGASMGVSVSKEGYLHISPLGGPASQATVTYANGSEQGKRYRNPNTPLVLRLQNPGQLEPLIHTAKTRWKLPIDGTPQLIALDSEGAQGSHKIEFQLWSNTRDRDKPGANVYDAFDWTFEARVPGGGFIWSDSDLNFEAPEGGYKESIRYHYPSSLEREKWKRFQNGRYFIKFPDGTHARIQFDIDAGSDRKPLYMQSWFNPKPGSRNLSSLIKDGSGFHGGDPK